MKVRSRGQEVRKVLFFWVVLFLAISTVSVAMLVYSSISLLNRKTEALKEDVAVQAADYYKSALETTIGYAMNNPGVLVGQELWDPDPNAPIDRMQTMERMMDLLKTSFNAEYVIYVTDQTVVAGTEDSTDLPWLPDAFTEGYVVRHDLEREGDTYISLCKKTDYPFIGPQDQYCYTVVDITRQTDAITALYEDSRSQLLWSQLIISLALLVLSLILAPVGIAWAVRKYVAAPILSLDKLSSKIMNGTMEDEVRVDEASSFADMQQLLAGAQKLLHKV